MQLFATRTGVNLQLMNVDRHARPPPVLLTLKPMYFLGRRCRISRETSSGSSQRQSLGTILVFREFIPRRDTLG
jgi:hypothetical protein